jgi:hypothetical protein
MADKRTYSRRSDTTRIAEMEAKIAELRKKIDQRARPDQDVVNEVPKIQKRLRDFAQLAMENGRHDIANSTMAFMAGLERMKEDRPAALKHSGAMGA